MNLAPGDLWANATICPGVPRCVAGAGRRRLLVAVAGRRGTPRHLQGARHVEPTELPTFAPGDQPGGWPAVSPTFGPTVTKTPTSMPTTFAPTGTMAPTSFVLRRRGLGHEHVHQARVQVLLPRGLLLCGVLFPLQLSRAVSTRTTTTTRITGGRSLGGQPGLRRLRFAADPTALPSPKPTHAPTITIADGRLPGRVQQPRDPELSLCRAAFSRATARTASARL